MLSHGGVIGASGAAAAGGGGSVTFYFNCDSATSGQSPQKGSGTITIDSLTAVTGSVGNALQGTAAWSSAWVPTSVNISASAGTLGFFVHPTANQNNQILFVAVDAPGSDPDFSLHGESGTSTYSFNYKSGGINFDLVNGSTYFLEMSWDGTANKMAVRLDGGTWSETTGLTGSNPTLASEMAFVSGNAAPGNIWIDQIIISSNYREDLYAIRNNTSF